MTSLFSIVPAGSDTVDLPTLESAAFDGDVLIDCLTDEELFWLRRGGASADPAMDEPYLATLDDPARRVATDSGLRSLIAKGMVDLDPDDPEQLEFIGAYAVLASLRAADAKITRLRLDVPDEESVRYSFSLITEGLVLTEEVADGGFHDFVLQSPASASVSLASIFDRHGTALKGPAATGTAGSATLHTVLVRFADGGDHGADRSMTVRGTSDGVFVTWHDEPGTQRSMTRSELEALAFDLILGERPVR